MRTVCKGSRLAPGVDLDDSAALLGLVRGRALILPDVGVLVYAFHAGAPGHERYTERGWDRR